MVLETHDAVIPLFDWGSKTTAQLLCYYGASLSEERVGEGERERGAEMERRPASVGGEKKNTRDRYKLYFEVIAAHKRLSSQNEDYD